MAESFSRIIVHIVFSTKGREKLIHTQIQEELYKLISQVIQNKGSHCFKVGGIEDHIHIACTLSRTTCVSELVRDIKNNSSRWISEKFQYFKWQDGYAAFSVSPSHLDALIAYIENQKEHHTRCTPDYELKQLYEKYDCF